MQITRLPIEALAGEACKPLTKSNMNYIQEPLNIFTLLDKLELRLLISDVREVLGPLDRLTDCFLTLHCQANNFIVMLCSALADSLKSCSYTCHSCQIVYGKNIVE